jgi:hypothetical protein
MTDQHSVIPPQELIEEWTAKINSLNLKEQLIMVAQWGADQELEACVKWIEDCGYHPSVPEDLRITRRPKSPSLKEQALALLQPGEPRLLNSKMQDTIRKALEALPNDN